MPIRAIREFLRYEAAAGSLLFAAATVAIILANTALAPIYGHLLDVPLTISVGAHGLAKPLLLWINDGLMAVFFLLVGLEIKREFIEGQLSTTRQALLPFVGAIGGMVLPAGIYIYLNFGHDPLTLNGWAIPAASATDSSALSQAGSWASSDSCGNDVAHLFHATMVWALTRRWRTVCMT